METFGTMGAERDDRRIFRNEGIIAEMAQPQLGAEKISAIDRLYRTQKERRQFEADTGLARLRVGDAGFALDRDSGHLAIYQQWFMGWALRRLAERASVNQ